MKQLLLLTCLFFSATLHAQQQGSIYGTVTTSDGKAADGVTINIRNTNKSAIANEGVFEFKKLIPGNYTLLISLVGFQDETAIVKVEAGKTVNVTFTLTASNKQLQEVIVTSGRNKLYLKQSNYVAKLR